MRRVTGQQPTKRVMINQPKQNNIIIICAVHKHKIYMSKIIVLVVKVLFGSSYTNIICTHILLIYGCASVMHWMISSVPKTKQS